MYSQTGLTYTFTNCGATGSVGPTQAQVNAAYTGTNPLNTIVTSLSGIQQWTVPITSVYRITAYGAQGGAGASTSGGLGASIRGDFTLTAGTIVNLIVGQSGSSYANGLGGGGGGSFIWLPNNLNQLLIAAGGGGGRSTNTGPTESFAGVGNSSTLSTNPTNGAGSGSGGINGNGGNGGSSGMSGTYPGGGGGAGWFSNGTAGGNGNINEGNGGTGGISPIAVLNAGKGGIGYNFCGAINVYGGFGGGGAGSGCSGSSGGGGGYNGGGGGNGWNGSTWCSGGGGGSFNSGANIQNLSGVRSGHGLILVQILCNTPALPVLGNTPSALDICPLNSINLIASSTGSINWYTSLNSTTSIGTGSSLITPTLNTGTYTYYVAGSTNTCYPSEGPRLAITVSVHPNPTISITGASTLCAGQTITLTANGANTYTWSTNSNLSSISVAPTSNITYTLSGTSTAGCLSAAAASLAVTVNTLPVVSISGTNALCTGQTITITANGANTYTWSTNSNLSSISVAPTSNITYTLSGTSTAGCESAAAASLAVTVNTLPVVSISGTNALCAGQTISLTANGANTYTWNTNSNASSIAVTPASNTSYSLSGTSAAGCVGSSGATQAVTVYSLPVVSISGTNALCAGQTITLTANGANTYTWNTNSIASSIAVTPASNTTYSLNGTSTVGCVSAASATLAVTVNTLPIVSISGTNALCSGQTITLTAIGATTYSWNHGPLTTTCAVNPISNTSFVVTGKTSLGCTGAPAIIAISVFSLPLVSISGASTLCAGDNLTLTANGANTYTWFNGSNSSSLITSPPSNTLFTLNGTSSNGCQNLNTSTISVIVFNRPNISITGTNALCSGQTINLTANGANTYTWNTGSNSNSISLSPTINTTYSVSGTNALGCSSNSFAVLAVNVYSLPVVSIAGTNTICFGQLAQLTAAGANSYTWSNGANTNSINVSPIANFTYGVIGSNLNGCLSPTVVQSINVYSLPIILASASSPSVCSGGSVTLNASGASSYTWNISPFNPITISPVNTATYTVAGTSPLGCLSQNTAAVSVSVFTTPSVTAGISNSLVCFGRFVSLQANGANTYTWNPPQLTNVPFTATASAQYTLTGTSTAGCTNTNLATVNLSVMSLPNVQMFGDSAFCFGTTSTLSANGANTYTWNTGSNLNTISITPSITSTYTLIGTALNTCSNIAVKQITVFPLPTVSASISKSVVCFGDTVILSGNGANTYSWTGGAGSGGTLIPSATSSYSLTGYSNSGCSSTNVAVVSITVNALPVITTGISNPSVCLGQTTSIYANGANSYTWTNGVLNGVAFIPTASTVYTVTGTDANGCINSAIQNVSVYPVPHLSIAASSYSVCEGKQVTLIGQGANTFTWSSGISNGVAFTPSVTSSYTLNGSFSTGCSNTISPVITVSVFGLPDITITTEKPGICPADSTELFYTGAETYTWIPPLGPGNFVKPKISSTYTVFGTDLWGCQNTSSVLITVHPLPTLQISSTNSVACFGEQVTLKASGAQTYTWNASRINSEYLFTASTNTQFTLYGSNVFGCLDTTTYNQIVQSCSVALLADLSKTDVSCESRNDASIEVNSTVQPRIPTTQYRISYKWIGTDQCINEDCRSLIALSKGDYTLMMIVTSTVNAHYQRTDTLIKTITINDLNPPCNLQPYHGITADNNAINDYFHIDNIDVYPNNSVEIYNRWGECIKRITYYNNTTNFWPTPEEVGDLQSGTYFYIIFTGDTRVKNLRGWIELLK